MTAAARSQNPDRDAEILKRHYAGDVPSLIAFEMGLTDNVVAGVIFRNTKRNKPLRKAKERPRTHLQAQIDRIIEGQRQSAERIAGALEETTVDNAAFKREIKRLLADQNRAIHALSCFLVDLAKDFHDAIGQAGEQPPAAEAPRANSTPTERPKYKPRTFRVVRVLHALRGDEDGQHLTARLMGDPTPGRSAADKLGEKA